MKNKFMILLGLIVILSISACTQDKDTVIGVDDPSPAEETKTLEIEDVQEPEEDMALELEEESEATTPSPGADSSIKWPEDFMSSAPKLQGEIALVKEEGPNKRYIELKDIAYDDAINYVDSIKEAGFTQNYNEDINANIVKYKAMDSKKNLIVFIWKKDITKVELIKAN
ncbi:MAG: hypothetical protein GX046_06420 [Tissierellia bacterium]|nr:hypothetical protein [Tissierellia bacterium]